METEENTLAALRLVNGSDFAVILEACLQALEITEATSVSIGAKLVEAEKVVESFKDELAALRGKQASYKRVIAAMQSSSLITSETQADTDDTSKEPQATLNLNAGQEEDTDREGNTSKKRLNVRGQLVNVITNTGKVQATRDIYDLACKWFNAILPLSTVNGGLSKLVEDGDLLRFPSPEERTSFYGPPSWFSDGRPRLEYLPVFMQQSLLTDESETFEKQQVIPLEQEIPKEHADEVNNDIDY